MSLAAATLTPMHLQRDKAKKNPARSGIGESYVLSSGVSFETPLLVFYA
jgi:hypothetical protein